MSEICRTGLPQSRPREVEQGVILTTFITIRIVRHSTKKVIVHPTSGGATAMLRGQGNLADGTLLSALARAIYWQDLLDSGRVANIAELAEAEKMEKVRVQKILKLARLAPGIAEQIARGEEPPGLTLEFFIRRELPDDWESQRQVVASLGCQSV